LFKKLTMLRKYHEQGNQSIFLESILENKSLHQSKNSLPFHLTPFQTDFLFEYFFFLTNLSLRTSVIIPLNSEINKYLPFRHISNINHEDS
jgi:hypothetical protein